MEEMIERKYYDAMKMKADRFEGMWRAEHENNKKLRNALADVATALMPFINPSVFAFLEEQNKQSKGRNGAGSILKL